MFMPILWINKFEARFFSLFIIPLSLSSSEKNVNIF